MKKILIATRNEGKLNEFKNFLSDLPLKIVSLLNLKIKEEVKEDGKTYEENSRKKALFYSKLSGLPAIADDGGIEISALNNQPGLQTRRWLGYKMTDEEIIAHMKKISRNLPSNNRKAYFKTVVSLVVPNGNVYSIEEEVKGVIVKKPYLKLLKGYPFRSFFYLPQIKKYYHEDELTIDEQKRYNHRYKAIEKLKPIIKKELNL